MLALKSQSETIAYEIASTEGRQRKRTAEAQLHFEYAIEAILKDVWKGTAISPNYESSIHRSSNWYSSKPRYRDPNLTYKQTIAAFDGMVRLRLVEVTKDGHFDHFTGSGEVTRYRPTDKLLEMLEGTDGDPFRDIEPNIDAECIVLRDRIDGVRTVIEYEPSAEIDELRKNLQTINACLAKNWPDLRITDDEYKSLQERLLVDDQKSPVDFSQRILTRIFSNGRFDQGGRFYRAWWHNVPSEYRKYITINGKRTCEYDYSQLNPHMAYYLRGADIGSEDAYSRVFDGDHRPLVKEAFNAMMQASTPLLGKPDGIDLSEVEFNWATLRQRVLDAHPSLADVFFQRAWQPSAVHRQLYC